MDKVVELVGGGSVVSGATPSILPSSVIRQVKYKIDILSMIWFNYL